VNEYQSGFLFGIAFTAALIGACLLGGAPCGVPTAFLGVFIGMSLESRWRNPGERI
jgi:hypothetical protein